MGRRWRNLVLVLAVAGCHTPATVAPRPATPTAVPVVADLPPTAPTVPVLDGKGLPKSAARTFSGPEGTAFRKLTEAQCLALSAANTGAANLLDDENRVPPSGTDCNCDRDRLTRSMRYYTALELRNTAAAAALDRFFQLADAEARLDPSRQAIPVIDTLIEKARAAKAADVRFPLDPADLERQRSQLVSQIEQGEHGSRLLNLDLKRRLGLPALPADDRLWPMGDFAIDAAPVDAEQAVTAALADRPELRGLRALHQGLTVETLPDVRDFLRASNPLLGQTRLTLPVRRLLNRKTGPDPAAVAELEVRKKQLFDHIATREREIADEARAAALAVNAQRVRAGLARDRVTSWEEKLAEAVKKREAKQPGAELEELQARLDLFKARAELAGEVAAWHQTRVRLKAAQGWLVWETVGGK